MKRRTKKRLAVVIIAVLALPIAGLGGRSLILARKERLLETARAEGMAAYERGDYATTLARLGYFVGRRQNDGEALLAFADAVEQTPQTNDRHLHRAKDANKLAVAALPGDIRPLVNLVRLYPQLGFAKETIGAADQVLLLDQTNESALRAKATSHLRLGEKDQARTTAEALLRSAPTDVWALNFITDARISAGESPASVQAWLREVNEAHPGDVDVLLTLARAEALAGEPDLAVATLGAAAKTPPKDDAQLRRLLIALDAFGQSQESERLLSEATSPEFALIGVERAWKQGRSDVALERAKAAAARGNPSVALLGMLEILAAGRGESTVAEPLADVEGAAAVRWRTLIAAHKSMQREAWAEARDALLSITQTAPDNDSLTLHGVSQFMLAAAQSALGNHTEAVAGWRELLRLDPTWTIAGMALVSELSGAGRVDEAYTEGTRLLMRSPGNALAARAYLLAVSRQLETGSTITGNLEDIRRSLELLRTAAGSDGDLLCLVAQIQIASQDHEGAAQTLADIAALPTPPSTPSLMRLSAATQDAPPTVRSAAFGLLSEADPNDPALVFAKAIEAGRAGRLEEGLQLLEDAIAKSPADKRLALELGRARYLRSIDQRRALDAFLAIAERESTNAMVQSELLSLPLLWLDCDKASEALRRLSAVVGKDASTWMVYEAKRQLECDGSQAAASAALLSLTAVLVADPLALEPTLLAADANLRLGDRDGAIKAISTYLANGGRDPRASIKLIPLLEEASRWQEVREAAERLARTEPIPASLAIDAGAALERSGFIPDARRLYIAAAEAGIPRADMALIAFGIRHRDEQTARDAVERLRQSPSTTLDPYEAIATFMIMQDKDIEGATRTLMDAPVEATPDDRTLALSRALMLADLNDEARQLLTERTDAGAAPAVWAQLIALDMDEARLEEASKTIERALQAHPGDERITTLQSVTDLAMGKGDTNAALEKVIEALGKSESNPELLEYAQFLRRHPETDEITPERIKDLTVLVTRRPTFLLGWRALIDSYLKTDRFSEAADAGRAVAAAMPADPGALRLATEALAGARHFQDALATAQQWQSVASADRIDADFTVAQLQSLLGRPEEGLLLLEPRKAQLIEQADRHPGPLVLLAELLAASGRESEARELLFDRALADPAWALRHLAVVRVLIQRPPVARAWLEQSESLTNQSQLVTAALGDAWRTLAGATEEQSDHAQAARWLALAAEAKPTVALWVALADAQAAAGDGDEAEASYRRALAMEEDPIAMNNLAGLIALLRPNDEEARRLATRAVALARSAKVPPDSLARFVDTLGYAELRAGRSREALAAFDEALALDPVLTESAVGRIEAMLASGDREGARISLRRLEDTKPRETRATADRLAALREALSAGQN